MKPRNFSIMLGVAIASAALFYFGREHWGHFFGVLPYLLFLSCPLMHLFMHHGHKHGRATVTRHGNQELPGSAALGAVESAKSNPC